MAGAAGVSSFTTADSFVMPAELANVTVTMVSSAWMGVGQVVFAAGGGFEGYFEVVSKADTTHAVLQNLEDATTSAYAGNSPAGSIFPALSTLQAGGVQGVAGSTPATALLSANNLSDVALAATARTNLGLGTAAVLTAGVANGNAVIVNDAAFTAAEAVFATATGVESQAAAGARTSLGLGTMATQAASAVAITGGTLNGTLGAATPGTAAVTALTSSGTRTAGGRWVQTPSTLQTLTAATAISADAEKLRVVGSPGAVTLTATPTISAGVADGQRVLIKGTSATLTVTLQDESALAGTTLELEAATRVLALNSQIELSWDSTTGKWCELAYSANT